MQDTQIAQIIIEYISYITFETIFGKSETIHWTIEDGGYKLVMENDGPSTKKDDVVSFTTSRPNGFDWTKVMYELFGQDHMGIIQEGNPFLQPSAEFSGILSNFNRYARHLITQARMGKIDWVVERDDGVHKGHWYARPYPLTNWMWHHSKNVDYVKSYYDLTKWQICEQVLPPSQHHLLT